MDDEEAKARYELIMSLRANGKSNAEIAKVLGLTQAKSVSVWLSRNKHRFEEVEETPKPEFFSHQDKLEVHSSNQISSIKKYRQLPASLDQQKIIKDYLHKLIDNSTINIYTFNQNQSEMNGEGNFDGLVTTFGINAELQPIRFSQATIRMKITAVSGKPKNVIDFDPILMDHISRAIFHDT